MLTLLDYIAVCYFIFCWLGFSIILRYELFPNRRSLSTAMNEHRKRWFLVASHRELRMIDTNIVAGLQGGVGFFASATLLAIGGCMAALGSIDEVRTVVSDLPATQNVDKSIIESKLVGLIALLGYSFFKFGWSYRLFNYCGILLGSIPARKHEDEPGQAEDYATRAGEMNVIAGRHFTAGLRGVFFAVSYLGWFVNPLALIVATTLVMLVLLRRQYFSEARRVAL